MRFLFCMLAWVSLGLSVQAQATDSLIFSPVAQQTIRQQQNAMRVLGAWSVLSMGTGTYQLLQIDPRTKAMGMQNLLWGAIDGGIAAYATYDLRKKIASGKLNWQEEKLAFRKILLINTLLDVVYVGVGLTLMQSKKPVLQGHGQGILIQGGFLLGFDAINYWLTFP